MQFTITPVNSFEVLFYPFRLKTWKMSIAAPELLAWILGCAIRKSQMENYRFHSNCISVKIIRAMICIALFKNIFFQRIAFEHLALNLREKSIVNWNFHKELSKTFVITALNLSTRDSILLCPTLVARRKPSFFKQLGNLKNGSSALCASVVCLITEA